MLGEYLQISRSLIYKKVSKQSIPYKKIGKSTRFDIEEIDRWVANDCKNEYELPKLQKL
ncbi:MAG: helix-turn-helix domain-containing protein [Bacteroidetes bacterium]|nr:helix-turn-helix domain-containing protein [Bacteroidota bacterium]